MSDKIIHINPCHITVKRLNNFVSLSLEHIKSNQSLEGVMTAEQARQLADFLNNHANEIEKENGE